MLKKSEDNISMMTITVGDLMRKKVDTIEETSCIQATAKKMKDKKVSSLLILDINGKPIGLVTERDLVRKVCINDVRTSQSDKSRHNVFSPYYH